MARKLGKRFGMVIGVRPEMLEIYKRLHSGSNRGVRDLLVKYNMRNFSIFHFELSDAKGYLFGYFEYVGVDFDLDMAKLGSEPRNLAWLSETGACQEPLQRKGTWLYVDEVFHNE